MTDKEMQIWCALNAVREGNELGNFLDTVEMPLAAAKDVDELRRVLKIMDEDLG